MRQAQTLTGGARLTGAVLCAFLALLTAAWIARDLHTARSAADLWWFWSGAPRHTGGTPLTTGFLDPVLLVVYVVAVAVVPRSPLATGVLAAVGAVTAALRISSLWVLHDHWLDTTALHELHRRALLSTFAALAAGLAMLITAAAGRRPSPEVGPPSPTRPGAGAGITAFVLLVAAAAVAVAWEIYTAVQVPGDLYKVRFSGENLPLLWVPAGWLTVVLAVVALTAAVGGLARAAFSRPLGLMAAAVLAASGALGIAVVVRFKLLDRFDSLSTAGQLQVVTFFFEVVVGVVLVPVLVRRGPPEPVDTAGAWPPAPGGGGFGPPPPSFPPPGW
ncbi:hypothetical protein [Streptomyces sp. CBMA152]|uniref:hypothetical protein n=1 Tax=Streptomyces sp. CBMA152 TaxID=1896312 RepID=UPI0016603B9C|nr:hypothetical protein [Streptomyces sp. CBMA152]MBD0745233.1 hypothetical protein [Streptomyces sp. CBMA152]